MGHTSACYTALCALRLSSHAGARDAKVSRLAIVEVLIVSKVRNGKAIRSPGYGVFAGTLSGYYPLLSGWSIPSSLFTA